jgi:hypothetical protein
MCEQVIEGIVQQNSLKIHQESSLGKLAVVQVAHDNGVSNKRQKICTTTGNHGTSQHCIQ